MKGKMSTKMGSVEIARDVIAKYAGAANAGRGVNLNIIDNKIVIELHVIVAYGVSIRAVAQNVLENVRYRVEAYTGMKVDRIDVIVEGVRITDED